MRDYRIGRLKGRFVVSWREDGKRRRYRLDALTRKDAEREAIDVIRAETLALSDLTVAGLWTAYRDHLGERPTAVTMKYTGIPILAKFGALRPDQITVEHCRAYVAQRVAAGRKRGAVWTELGHLRSCMSWARKMHLIERAPYIELPQKPAPKDRYLTHAEIDRLIDAARLSEMRSKPCQRITFGRHNTSAQTVWGRHDRRMGRPAMGAGNALRCGLGAEDRIYAGAPREFALEKHWFWRMK